MLTADCRSAPNGPYGSISLQDASVKFQFFRMPASSVSTSVSVRIYEYASADRGQANQLLEGTCSACRPGGKPAGDVPATAIVDSTGQFSLSDSVLGLNGDNGIVGRLLEVVTSSDTVVTQCTIGRSSEDMATQGTFT